MKYVVLYAGEAEVQIRITDTNDNVPYFSERIYSFSAPDCSPRQ